MHANAKDQPVANSKIRITKQNAEKAAANTPRIALMMACLNGLADVERLPMALLAALRR